MDVSQIISTIIGGSFFAVLGWFGYRIVISLIFTDKGIDWLSNKVDDQLDKLQTKNTAAGKITRDKLIKLAENIIKRAKENDGIN